MQPQTNIYYWSGMQLILVVGNVDMINQIFQMLSICYLAIQRSVWRDIKFSFCFFFVCTVEDISTQDGAIGVKFWLRVEQTPGTGTR